MHNEHVFQVCEKYQKYYPGGISGGQIVANKGFSAFRIEQVLTN